MGSREASAGAGEEGVAPAMVARQEDVEQNTKRVVVDWKYREGGSGLYDRNGRMAGHLMQQTRRGSARETRGQG